MNIIAQLHTSSEIVNNDKIYFYLFLNQYFVLSNTFIICMLNMFQVPTLDTTGQSMHIDFFKIHRVTIYYEKSTLRLCSATVFWVVFSVLTRSIR